MTSLAVLGHIERVRVVAILRKVPDDRVEGVSRAVVSGGLQVMEITLDSEGALDMIKRVKTLLGQNAVVGAGTVLDEASARAAILAGAEFLVTPNLDPRVVQTALRYGKVVIPGALTPTEILNAVEMGAQAVKIFPAGALGPEYIRQVKAPLKHVRLVPTGGVSSANARAFLEAGAFALGIGGSLVDPSAVNERRYDLIEAAARRIAESVRDF